MSTPPMQVTFRRRAPGRGNPAGPAPRSARRRARRSARRRRRAARLPRCRFVEPLHALARLGGLQLLARQAVLVGDRDAHLADRRYCAPPPTGRAAAHARGAARRARAPARRSPSSPAACSSRRLAVLRVVLRLQIERHAEMLAPAIELERVVRAPRLGARAQRHAAGARHDVLEVERLEDAASLGAGGRSPAASARRNTPTAKTGCSSRRASTIESRS